MKRVLLFFILICSITLLPAYSEVSDIDIEINSLYAANKLDEAFNLLVSIPQDERTAHQLLIMGNIMQDNGRNEDATFMYNSAIGADPTSYKAYYNLGNMYLLNNQPYLAIEKYKLALKYNKEFAPAYYNLGCAYIKINDLKKAKNALHDAIYFNPNNEEYHYNLAFVYKELGKTKDAQTYLNYYNKLHNGY